MEKKKKIPGRETLVMTAEALCDAADIERVMKASPASPTPPLLSQVTAVTRPLTLPVCRRGMTPAPARVFAFGI